MLPAARSEKVIEILSALHRAQCAALGVKRIKTRTTMCKEQGLLLTEYELLYCRIRIVLGTYYVASGVRYKDKNITFGSG